MCTYFRHPTDAYEQEHQFTVYPIRIEKKTSVQWKKSMKKSSYAVNQITLYLPWNELSSFSFNKCMQTTLLKNNYLVDLADTLLLE